MKAFRLFFLSFLSAASPAFAGTTVSSGDEQTIDFICRSPAHVDASVQLELSVGRETSEGLAWLRLPPHPVARPFVTSREVRLSDTQDRHVVYRTKEGFLAHVDLGPYDREGVTKGLDGRLVLLEPVLGFPVNEVLTCDFVFSKPLPPTR